MKNKWGWRKRHNLTECATAMVLGIAKLTHKGLDNAGPEGQSFCLLLTYVINPIGKPKTK